MKNLNNNTKQDKTTQKTPSIKEKNRQILKDFSDKVMGGKSQKQCSKK